MGAMEVLEQHHDLEEVRALLGHPRMDTTQIYAHQAAAAEGRDGVLLNAGRPDAERVRM